MKQKQSGSTVVLSMIVIIVLAMCVAGAMDYTLQTYRDAQQTNGRTQAVAAATGALDLAFVQWRAACRAQENVVLSSGSITSGTYTTWNPVPSYTSLTGTSALAGSYMNISGMTNAVSVSLSALNATSPTSVDHPLASGSAPIPSEAQSYAMPTYDYLAKATASYQSLEGTQTVSVYRIFQKVTESPWLYALFFNDDLEINPGNTFHVTGWVQTNGNLYTGGGGSNSNNLTFDSTVNYAGSWNSNGQWDPDDTYHSGTPAAPSYVSKPSPGPAQLPENSSLLSTASTNPNLSDGYHEIIEPPNTSYTDPLASSNPNYPSERYYYQAGVRIMIAGSSRSSPTVQIYDSTGTLLTGGTNQSILQRNIYNAFNPALTTNSTLYDGREGQTVALTTLDISKITSALNGSLAGQGCNIVYIDDTFANQNGPANNGVQLINGYNMPSGGLTVVSDNPVYIQGDYNTCQASSDITKVGSNQSTSTPTQNSYTGYTVQPCAVMADAVTILSNSWVNATSISNPSTPQTASNTTINTAILSGIVTSARAGSGQTFEYSGGAENFLRLLENWSNKYLTYYGSMSELYKSKQATGVWSGSGYYNPPIRQWYFNIGFYSSPPPGTFTVISYVKSRWFIE